MPRTTLRTAETVESRLSNIDPAADRVLVVVNPHSGAARHEAAVRRLIECMHDRRLAAEVVTELARAESLAEQYHAAGEILAVVAAGGDGTVAAVVNRLQPDVPVSVYPLGTANLLAGYFAIPRDPTAFVEMLLARRAVSLDAASANGRVFLLMAGCGFDAEVVGRLHRKRNGRAISYWSYARPIIETICSYEYPELRVYCQGPAGGEPSEFAARWAFAVNLPCYAGGLRLAPRAVGTDGLLDVSMFRGGSIWHTLRYVSFVMFGRQHVLSDYRLSRATRVRIESDKPVSYQLDGDPGGVLPLEIEALPRRLTLVAPLSRIRALAGHSETDSGAAAG
jgi:diacylglycerol kinase family enzyme